MHAETSWIERNGKVAVAMTLATALAGYLGAGPAGLDAPKGSPTSAPVYSGPTHTAPNPNVGSVRDVARFRSSFGSEEQPGTSDVSGRQSRATSQPVDQFARPVEEMVTEEMILNTDLSGEGSTIQQIFMSQEHLEQLLGTDASFIYNASGRRDPMIIPWIRREYDMGRLMELARAAEQMGRFEDALDMYRRVANNYSGRTAMEAAAAVDRLSGSIVTASGTDGQARQIYLPREIQVGLTGILYEDSDPNCLIGEGIYGVGDIIDAFDVTILDIHEEEVVFLYQEQEFTVPVVSN